MVAYIASNRLFENVGQDPIQRAEWLHHL